MIEFLLKEALNFHAQLDAAAGIRDIRLVESAIESPFQTFGGQDLCPTIFDKAARLFYGLTQNHGFVDGNKRVALHTTEVFLHVNNFVLRCSEDELVDIGLKIAKGLLTVDKIKFWLLRKAAGMIFITGNITIKI